LVIFARHLLYLWEKKFLFAFVTAVGGGYKIRPGCSVGGEEKNLIL
jgi:hypothetical protein